MNKVIKVIIIQVIAILMLPVQAANYEIRELIPINTETSIVTDNFSYRNFFYNNNKVGAETLNNNAIIFGNIRNMTDKELPVSVSIGLFDEEKKNIGIINYCSKKDGKSEYAGTVLKSKEGKAYVIEVDSNTLAPEKSILDVKYIAVLSDNINCRVTGSHEFIGKKVEEIKISKNSILEYNSTKLFINIISAVAVFLVVLFVYQFLFTNSYKNFNGDDVRQEYAYINKQLAKKRRRSKKIITPPPVQTKSNEVKAQEIRENQKENKEATDLHNLYK